MGGNHSYELFLHGKQGEDFAWQLDQTKGDVPDALRSWAQAFKAHHDACLQIAQVLDGKKVGARADVHFISFEPLDDKAEAALEELVKEELLAREEWDDGEAADDEAEA